MTLDDRRWRAGKRSCYNCTRLKKWIESCDMPHIGGYGCYMKVGVENLTSFPFLNTKCELWIEVTI